MSQSKDECVGQCPRSTTNLCWLLCPFCCFHLLTFHLQVKHFTILFWNSAPFAVEIIIHQRPSPWAEEFSSSLSLLLFHIETPSKWSQVCKERKRSSSVWQQGGTLNVRVRRVKVFSWQKSNISALFFVFLVPVNVLWLLLVPVLKNVDTINIYRPILEFSFVHSPIRSTDTDVWFHWLYALNWKEVLYTGGDTALWDMKRTWQWGHQAGKCHIFWFNKIAILFLAMFLIPILWDLVFYPNQHMSNNDKITQIQYVLFITH